MKATAFYIILVVFNDNIEFSLFWLIVALMIDLIFS